MDLGEPQREYINEPLEEPVPPLHEPAPDETAAPEREREETPVGA